MDCDVNNILKEHGVSDAKIAFFNRLDKSGNLWPNASAPLFTILRKDLIEIDPKTYNGYDVYKITALPDAEYTAKYDALYRKSSSDRDRDLHNHFPDIIDAIKRFSKAPSELSAAGLYRALDLDDVLSYMHNPNDGYSEPFFNILKRTELDKPALCDYLVFICLKSNDAHIIQNALFVLWAIADRIPFILLDVLGRYEPFNLASYDLIDRVPNIDSTTKEALQFTHFKFMDSEFYFRKIDVIEASDNAMMKHWMAVNVSNTYSITYFCKHFVSRPEIQNDYIFAALSHFIWCLKETAKHISLQGDEAAQTLLQSHSRILQDYIHQNFDSLSLGDKAIEIIKNLYGSLAMHINLYGKKSDRPDEYAEALSIAQTIAAHIAKPDYDSYVTTHAPDFKRQPPTRHIIAPPPPPLNNLFIDAKRHSAKRWFPRELSRVKSGDLKNWRMLITLIENGEQFNAVSAWLLQSLKTPDQQPYTINVFGEDTDTLLKDLMDALPKKAPLYLHSQALFILALGSNNRTVIQSAISALRHWQRQDMRVPDAVADKLRRLDKERISRISHAMRNVLLGGKLTAP